VELLRRETPEFIAPDMCPPNSLDRNPVYCHIWGAMHERIYASTGRGKCAAEVDEYVGWLRDSMRVFVFVHKVISNSCSGTACHVFDECI